MSKHKNLGNTAKLLSGLIHPDRCPKPWNIRRDFIDPLAEELEEWLRKSNHTLEGIEILKWFKVGWNRAGTDDAVGAWDRAKVFFQAEMPPEFGENFVGMICGLSDQAGEVECRLRAMAKSNDRERWDAQVDGFIVQYVEPCLQYLRFTSQGLQKRFPFSKLQRRKKKSQPSRPRGRQIDPLTIQRREFSAPLREAGKTWPEIYALYHKKHPSDSEASAATLRLAYKRRHK